MSAPEYIEEVENPEGKEVTPSFAHVIESAIRANLVDVHVSMPATVESYNKDKQSVDVTPSLKRKYNSGEVVALPKIFNVPVMFPRAGNAIIAMPISQGDVVTLVFADQSIDKWLTSGGTVDPDDLRSHHLSDAVAFPGGYPFSEPAELANDKDIIIKHGTSESSSEIRIKSNGHIQILNKNNELITLLTELIEAIVSGRVATGGGPQPLLNPANPFPTQLAKLNTFKER